MKFIVFVVADDEFDRVTLVPIDPRDGAIYGVRLVTDGSPLGAIVGSGALLDYCDSVEIHELQQYYLPRARQQALASESRTRPVRLATSPKTVAISTGDIQREFDRAIREETNEQGQ